MSDLNTAAVLRSFEAFNRNDVDAVVAEYRKDCKNHDPPDLPDAGIHEGHEGVRNWVSNMRMIGGAGMSLEPAILGAKGDIVLARAVGKDMGQGSRVPIEWTAYGVFKMREGKIAVARIFLDEAAARGAAGF